MLAVVNPPWSMISSRADTKTCKSFPHESVNSSSLYWYTRSAASPLHARRQICLLGWPIRTMQEKPIYLDFNATTPIAPEVGAAISQALIEPFGNPSSEHWAGLSARQAVDKARAQVAAFLHCGSDEVVFTSGGSESNNHALKGAFFAEGGRNGHIITTQIEHPAILNPCRFLERLGASVTYLPVDRFGRVGPDDVRRALTPRTILISVMHANNEVGTLQPVGEIGCIAREHG